MISRAWCTYGFCQWMFLSSVIVLTRKRIIDLLSLYVISDVSTAVGVIIVANNYKLIQYCWTLGYYAKSCHAHICTGGVRLSLSIPSHLLLRIPASDPGPSSMTLHPCQPISRLSLSRANSSMRSPIAMRCDAIAIYMIVCNNANHSWFLNV